MQFLNRLQPIHKAALTSCSLMALGDVTCQTISCKSARKPVQIDMARAARFGLIGLTLHGPFFFKGFQWLDSQFGAAPTLKSALTKTLTGQVTLFPTYTTLVLLYASLLEGQGLQHGVEKVKSKGPNLFITGSVYWPAVNLMNFLYVPPTQRILAVNACAIVWNAYLSYINAAPLPATVEAVAVAS